MKQYRITFYDGAGGWADSDEGYDNREECFAAAREGVLSSHHSALIEEFVPVSTLRRSVATEKAK